MKKIIYLSGAMGCYGDNPYPEIWRTYAEYCLEAECLTTFNPTKFFTYLSNATEKEIMRYELNKIRESSVILVNLKDLDKSLGTSDEILLAYLNNIPVIGFDETCDEVSVHPWKNEQIDKIFTGSNAIDKAAEYIKLYYS